MSLTEEHITKLREWINSDPMSSESDCSDDEEPVLGGLVPCRITVYGPSGQPMTNRKRLIEMIGQQSDASPPESEPTPEPSGEAEPEQQEPPLVLPGKAAAFPAPKLLRSRRLLPGQPHQ